MDLDYLTLPRFSLIFFASVVFGVIATGLSGQFLIVGFYETGQNIVSGYGFPLAWNDHYYIPNGCCPPHPGADWASIDLVFFGLDVVFYIAIVFVLLLIPKLPKLLRRSLEGTS